MNAEEEMNLTMLEQFRKDNNRIAYYATLVKICGPYVDEVITEEIDKEIITSLRSKA